MSRFRGFVERLRHTVLRRRTDSELDDEIRFHLDRETRRLVQTGLHPTEARRLASEAFGSVLHVKEQVRSEAGFPLVEALIRDLRYAARGLRRSPGFASAAVLTLGLGIGATTAVYSLVDHVLLRPLPYPDPGSLVQVMQQNSPTNRWHLSVADVLGIDEHQGSLQSLAAAQPGSVAFTGRGRPEQIGAARVTAEWFRTLGVDMLEGRGFLPEEGAPGAQPVAVIAQSLRARIFGVGPDPIGTTITLDGVPHVVVGVLDERWRTLAGIRAEVWPILQLETPTRRGPFGLRAIARLAPGTTLELARSDLEDVSRRIFPQWADGFRDETALLTPYSLRDVMVGGVGSNLWLLMGAVLGVLLIAVANVSNLLLVRASSRETEMALRSSLGATGFHLGRQLLTESALLSAIGGMVAIVLAGAGLKLLVVLGPTLPRLEEVALDLPVLAVAALITLASAMMFGMAPLAQATSDDNRTILSGGRGSTIGGRSSGWFRSGLVVLEFAIAYPLLAGALLLIGSLSELANVNPGFDPEGLVSATVSLPAETYPDYAAIQAFWDEALRRVNELPSVEVSGVGTSLPPDGGVDSNNFDLVSRPVDSGQSEPVSLWSWTSPGYLAALGIPLRSGRLLEPSDDGTQPPVAVVSESWVARHVPDGDGLGTQFYSGGDRSTAMTVVGVVGDVKLAGLATGSDAAVYEPFSQITWRRAHLVIRARGSKSDAVDDAREVISSLDPTLPLSNVQTMSDRMENALSQPRRWTTLLGLFSILGLVLSAVGAYGVLSFHVGQQTRDLGIRMALGADPSEMRTRVILRGMGLATSGLVIGLVVSVLSARWIESLVYGLSPTDPRVLAAVAAVLLAVALLSCLLPARRATRIDPIDTLRAE